MLNLHNTKDLSRDEKRFLILVKGIVQGVGFRPFIYNLARELDLSGQVANTGNGVKIHIQGTQRQLCTFLDRLRNSPPAPSRIDSIAVQPDQEAAPVHTFSIIASEEGNSATLVSPDLATCDDCLSEILDPADRRFNYPFTNCTNCGPRLTIIRKIPYDRPHTTMAAFAMCLECRREYEDPTDRRFHAQPNACPVCGPRVRWHDRDGNLLSEGSNNVLDACAEALANGFIVAIKGLGGFHLAVDATSKQAIARLRRRKNRPDKPLAVMVRDLDRVRQICEADTRAEALLRSREHPIVLLPKKNLPPNEPLAPGMAVLGVMLPYTPLHHLLFARSECPDLLVMTSGNKSGAPICTANGEALSELADIADFFLLHNRDIVTRVDDSLVRISAGKTRLIRRARGYAPLPVPLSGMENLPSVLSCGAELKNTFCLTRANEAFISQHIGDLKAPDNLIFFEESIRFYQKLLTTQPRIIARDLHPDYLSSRYADTTALPAIRIQHHQAHAGAVMAEHGLDECLAVVYDGAGLGEDGTIWGGEFFSIHRGLCLRKAHLHPFFLPGGDLATREIWRIGLALLRESGLAAADSALPALEQEGIGPKTQQNILLMMNKGINAPRCTSMGRLFDGVAALLGIRQTTTFEAQAAMELESLALQADVADPEVRMAAEETRIFANTSSMIILDHRPMIRRIIADRRTGMDAAKLALFFHHWLTLATGAVIEKIFSLDHRRNQAEHPPVVLAGGCFQNRLLLEMVTDTLEDRGFKVYSGEEIPVNDGGIALGQAWLAGMRHQKQ
jgi:hydrogenase maturation protein HypF